MKNLLLLLSLMFAISCATKNDLEIVLSSSSDIIQTVMNDPQHYEIQILYTQIDRNEKGHPVFTDYEFNVSDKNYYYPASTVKLPIAVLALEKLERLQEQDIAIDIHSYFKTANDSTYITIKEAITKIFAVSDNHAYNQLFEFLGQDEIKDGLISKKLKALITHRLSTENAASLKTQAVVFKKTLSDTTYIYKQPSIWNETSEPLSINRIQKGIGYIENNIVYKKTMDFSKKNYLPLRSLHQMMKRIHFPKTVPKKEQFILNDTHRTFLCNAMKTLPIEAGYNTNEYYDGYVKFFMFGDLKEEIPPTIKIYNKVGYAYGYLTDSAYIKDESSFVEFMLSATIHVNKNGIFNDDIYEYETIGIPFLATLGRSIYELERKRKE